MSNQYKNYFDEEVLTASPLKSVHLLYRGALDSVASARRHLKLRDIRARSRAIGKAMGIVTELSLSLNLQAGGELSRNLAELYGYIESLLIKANREQCDPPLAEAERLLGVAGRGVGNLRPARRGSSGSPGNVPAGELRVLSLFLEVRLHNGFRKRIGGHFVFAGLHLQAKLLETRRIALRERLRELGNLSLIGAVADAWFFERPFFGCLLRLLRSLG